MFLLRFKGGFLTFNNKKKEPIKIQLLELVTKKSLMKKEADTHESIIALELN